MGPGHLGIGLAAKPVAPKAPLWALFVASEALDLLSAVFITTGVERMAVTQMDFGQGLSIISQAGFPGRMGWSCPSSGHYSLLRLPILLSKIGKQVG